MFMFMFMLCCGVWCVVCGVVIVFWLCAGCVFVVCWLCFCCVFDVTSQSRRVIRSFQLKILQHLSDVSLIRLDCDTVTTALNDTIQYSAIHLKVCVFRCRIRLVLYSLDIF